MSSNGCNDDFAWQDDVILANDAGDVIRHDVIHNDDVVCHDDGIRLMVYVAIKISLYWSLDINWNLHQSHCLVNAGNNLKYEIKVIFCFPTQLIFWYLNKSIVKMQWVTENRTFSAYK